jgi:hypothetical protein
VQPHIEATAACHGTISSVVILAVGSRQNRIVTW